MPGSFVSNYVHIVFSARDRANLIHLSLQTALFDVMIHLAGEMNCPVIAIGGMPNHVHILLSLHQDCRISYTVRDIKADSSHWLHDHGVEFAWQSGYGAFSIGNRDISVVTNYIKNQETHHKRFSFDDELVKMFRYYQVGFDPIHT